jgi:enoyl-CoA hydratase
MPYRSKSSGIGAAFDEVTSSKARALIVTGAGPKAFCAGADIKELRNRDLVAQKRGAELGQAVFAKLDTLPMPSIAVINGIAFGGGLELALACTFLATGTQMGLPRSSSLIPGYGGAAPGRVIGEARALEMILTGRQCRPRKPGGPVNRLVEGDPIEAGLAFAHEFTSYACRRPASRARRAAPWTCRSTRA